MSENVGRLLALLGVVGMLAIMYYLTRRSGKSGATPEAEIPKKAEPRQEHAETTTASEALTQKEQQIQQLLLRVVTELKAHPDPLLPIVSLEIQTTMLGKQIVWCFATDYGVALNTQAAEMLLNKVLKTLGIVVSVGSYMGGPGSRNHLFSYRTITTESLEYEAEVKRLDEMKREPAIEEAKRLLRAGEISVLVGWLCYGRYQGIPAEVLRESQNPEAAKSLVKLLRDDSAEIRARVAGALGPLGGKDAAEALCYALDSATADGGRAIAKALGRLAWTGAVPSLSKALKRASTAWDRTCVAESMVRCGNKEGFGVLFQGLLNDQDSNEYAGGLSRLDQDSLSDAKLVPEMKSLVERTRNNNSSSIALEVLKRHGAVDESNCLKDVPALVAKYSSPRPGGEGAEKINGFVSLSIERASEVTGLSVEEIRELVNRNFVFALNAGSLVQVHGDYPRGQVLYHANPRWRSIGAKPTGKAAK